MENSTSWQLVVTWVMTGAAGFLLLLRLFGMLRFWRQSREIQSRRNVDISDLNMPSPDGLRPTISELEALGFQRLGEAQIEHIEKGPIRQVWVLVNAERTVFVEVVLSPLYAACGFTTVFGDGAITEVFYPDGEHIDSPDYVHRRNRVSVADAYRQQLDQVSDFYSVHGAPRPINTMQDCLEAAALFREHYSRQMLRAVWRTRGVVPLAANFLLIILLVGLLVIHSRFGLPEPLFFGTMLVAGAIYFLWLRPKVPASRRPTQNKSSEA